MSADVGRTRIGYVKPGRREDYGLWLHAQGLGLDEIAEVCAVTVSAVRVWLREAGVVLFRPARCGTPGGYNAHRREGETACDACRKANTAHVREWRKRKAAA